MNETERKKIGNIFKMISSHLKGIMYVSIVTIILSLVNAFMVNVFFTGVFVMCVIFASIITFWEFAKVCSLINKVGNILLQDLNTNPPEQ
tara:strand:- start:253 stop:522 length:270 start_codon:yes stop_codon:yes gene_type:complete